MCIGFITLTTGDAGKARVKIFCITINPIKKTIRLKN
jgi:hypothetical protein